jgi:hypothetical protein
MFILRTPSNTPAIRRNGTPFVYSSRELARMGAKALEKSQGPLNVARFEGGK